jgi:L-threonylcarbamoyladenylate synthase
MKTEILSTRTPALFKAAVRRAAALLRAGEIVALPTETVYGLAANAWNADAVAKIFRAKGRPAHNPVIVHVASLALARRCVADWPKLADKLAKAFWPGPLTLVLPRAKEIPEIVSAGGPTVGVRWPSHPFIQAVIRECGFPLAAPSANPSGRLSPTSAEHVHKNLEGKIRLIVDGGPAQVGIESTVLDLTSNPPTVLRPGMIRPESLEAAIGEVQRSGFRVRSSELRVRSSGITLRSAGLLKKHYAPRATLLVLSWRNGADLKWQIANRHLPIATCHVIAHSRVPGREGFGRVSVIPRDPDAFARAIYAALHRADAAGAELTVVEAPPASPRWRAIADRLRRAAAP